MRRSHDVSLIILSQYGYQSETAARAPRSTRVLCFQFTSDWEIVIY
jgi:hypothetical protein